jgi:antirestriction protein ArdC
MSYEMCDFRNDEFHQMTDELKAELEKLRGPWIYRWRDIGGREDFEELMVKALEKITEEFQEVA